jgi:hypothetical protein
MALGTGYGTPLRQDKGIASMVSALAKFHVRGSRLTNFPFPLPAAPRNLDNVQYYSSTITPKERHSVVNWNSYPKRASDLEINDVTDGYVVSRPGDHQIHYLNASAAFILECCDGAHKAEQLSSLIADFFETDHACVFDVEACLAALSKAGLIEVLVDPSASS